MLQHSKILEIKSLHINYICSKSCNVTDGLEYKTPRQDGRISIADKKWLQFKKDASKAVKREMMKPALPQAVVHSYIILFFTRTQTKYTRTDT